MSGLSGRMAGHSGMMFFHSGPRGGGGKEDDFQKYQSCRRDPANIKKKKNIDALQCIISTHNNLLRQEGPHVGLDEEVVGREALVLGQLDQVGD